MKVSAFMVPAKHAFTCAESDTIAAALDLIVNRNISAVVVLQEPHKPAGIVTKSDLVAAYRDGVPLTDPVSRIMNRDICWLDATAPRDDAAKALEGTRRHHALVREGPEGTWVGLISSWDIAAECAKDARAWPWNRQDPVKIFAATGYAH